MKKLKVIFLVIGIILIGLLLFHEQIGSLTYETKKIIYEKLLNQEIISQETGEINNSFFSIDDTGKTDTTNEINEAIQYAKQNNIEYIKFRKGTYLVDGGKKNQQHKGILLESNMTIDFNGSTIIQKTSKEPYYSVIEVNDKENIKILNGIIQGDRTTHDYQTIQSTHQWGLGIEIKNAKNIQVSNLQIKDMTGDAIYISEKSENIYISNCTLSQCRRQGISIIEGKNIDIYQNEIYKIQDQTPQSGIDLESNNADQLIENVKIYDNKFYGFGNNIAIQLYRYINNTEIKNNIIHGKIICYNVYHQLDIIQNKIYDGGIQTENKYTIHTVNVLQNDFTRSTVELKGVENAVVDQNNLYESSIEKENILQ